MDSKILLVDDEKDIADLIEEVLRQDSFENIKKVYTGMDAVQVCREYQPDVVVLDIMLPDIGGIEVCKQIREFSFCSILFLSSKNDDIDKILGLSCGGDDYITKPFSPREIVYRIKAQLRRQQSVMRTDAKGLLTVGGLALDRESCRIFKKEKEIDLTGREFLLLSYLMEMQIRLSVRNGYMNRCGGNTAAFVITQSWYIFAIFGKRLKIPRQPRNN